MTRKTIDEIKAHKNKAESFACLTAYTTPMATILARHVDLLLVGDSVGTVLYGMNNTTGVSIDIMIAHGKAVMRAAPGVPVIVDMPYGTYEDNPRQAVDTAQRIINATGAQGVKLEGGVLLASHIKAVVEAGIPVMGHIGLQPQSVEIEGGYKIKGKTEEDTQRLIKDAKALEEAGCFAFVLEGTIADAAATISAAVNIPSIGIGASVACDGQILVSEDMLGLLGGNTPKFVKHYADLAAAIDEACARYVSDVKAGAFPSDDYLYGVKKPALKDVS